MRHPEAPVSDGARVFFCPSSGGTCITYGKNRRSNAGVTPRRLCLCA